MQRKEYGPYFELSASQASLVTLDKSGDDIQRKTYINFLISIQLSIERLI